MAMTRWEYWTLQVEVGGFLRPKVEKDVLDAVLDEVGAEGWELVSALDLSRREGFSDVILAVFKRPLE